MNRSKRQLGPAFTGPIHPATKSTFQPLLRFLHFLPPIILGVPIDTAPFTIRDAIEGVKQRRFLVAVIFMAILISVGISTLMTTKTYESQAKIFVRLGRENVGLDPTTTLGEGAVITTPMSRDAEINSVVHMIRSRNLYEEVVDKFGAKTIMRGTLTQSAEPDTDDRLPSTKTSMTGSIRKPLQAMGVLNSVPLREQAIIKVAKKVSVKVLEHSNVIMVSYESESPEIAQQVVSYLLDRYIELHVKLHRPSGAHEFMEKQTAGIATLLATKEQQLEDFNIKTGMLSSELQKSALVNRIATVKTQIRNSAVELVALESEVTAIRSQLTGISPTLVSSKTTGAGNEGVDGMRQQLYLKEIQLAELMSDHTENHPLVKALAETIKTSKMILAKDETDRTESILGANPVHASIQIDLLKKESQLSAAKAKVELLQKELTRENKQLVQFSRDERKFVQLSRDLAIQDDSYRRYVRSVAQATVDVSLEKSKLSNISISQPASFSEKPLKPNKLINLIAGLFLATSGSVGLAIYLAYMDTPLQNEEQVVSTFELPIVASISRLTPQQTNSRIGG